MSISEWSGPLAEMVTEDQFGETVVWITAGDGAETEVSAIVLRSEESEAVAADGREIRLAGAVRLPRSSLPAAAALKDMVRIGVCRGDTPTENYVAVAREREYGNGMVGFRIVHTRDARRYMSDRLERA